jgi:hypothetical protein
MPGRESTAAAASSRTFDRRAKLSTNLSANSLPIRRGLTLRCLRARSSPWSGLTAPRPWTPTISGCATAGSAPTETRARRWRIWAVGHPLGTCPSRHTRRNHHPFPPMVVMPMKIASATKTSAAIRPPRHQRFSFSISCSIRLRRASRRSCAVSFWFPAPVVSSATNVYLSFLFRGAKSERSVSLQVCSRTKGRALIMLHQRQRRSAMAKVSCGEAKYVELGLDDVRPRSGSY